MSRFKIALGLFVTAGAMVLIAIAIVDPNARSRPMSDPGRKATEHARSDQAIASEEKKPPARLSESDVVLKSFAKSPGETARTESNAPRMQQRQIKMH